MKYIDPFANGNCWSKEIVADRADDALYTAAAEWREDVDDEKLSFKVEQKNDPTGRIEELLKQGERRRLEDWFYQR